MSMTEETVLDKVSKLLAKAEDPGATPEEAQSFVQAAQRLMAKYQIDEALLDAKRGANKQTVVEPVSKKIFVPNPFRNSKAFLVCAVARQNGCKSVLHPDARYGKRGYEAVTVVGMPRDVEWVEVLYTSLLLQLTSEMINTPVTGTYFDYNSYETKKVHGKTFRKNFIEGFTSTVEGRLSQARRQAEAEAQDEHVEEYESGSMALALLDKGERVSAAYKKLFPKLGKAASYSSTKNSSGYSQGSAAGQRANLSGKSVGSQRAIGR